MSQCKHIWDVVHGRVYCQKCDETWKDPPKPLSKFGVPGIKQLPPPVCKHVWSSVDANMVCLRCGLTEHEALIKEQRDAAAQSSD